MGVQVITSDQANQNRGFLIGTALARGLNETAQTLLAIATRREEARQRDEALQARVAQAAEALEERRMRRQELGEYRKMQLSLQQQGLFDRREIAEMNDATRRDIANMNHDARMEALALRESLARMHEANRWDRETQRKPSQLERLLEDAERARLGLPMIHNPNANPRDILRAANNALKGSGGGLIEALRAGGIELPGDMDLPAAATPPSTAPAPAAAAPAPTGVTSKGNTWTVVVPAGPSVATTPVVPPVTGTPSSSTATTPRALQTPYPVTRGSR